MMKPDKTKMMQDIGKLFYGKNELTFSLEKFIRSIQDAPVINSRLVWGKSDE